MTQKYGAQTEALLLEEYLSMVPAQRLVQEKERLLSTCQEFHLVYPFQSILDYTHTTVWINGWVESICQRFSPSRRISRIVGLNRWWSWLFDQYLIDNNVLACFYPASRLLAQTVPLVLDYNLQRAIASYLDERGARKRDVRRKTSRVLNNLNVFIHHSSIALERRRHLDEELVLSWLRQLSKTQKLRSLGFVAGITNNFLQYLVETGRYSANPLQSLREKYHGRTWRDFLADLLPLQKAPTLFPAVQPRAFVSALALHLEAFVELKRAMGRKYKATEKDLRQFDRFVAGFPGSPDEVTSDLIHAWMDAASDLHPKTRKKRLGLVRQFCLYLARHNPQTYVPDWRLAPVKVPRFKPHIYSAREFRALLKAAREIPSPRTSLRPKTFYTALLILYGTGLRISEVLRLRLGDVDIKAGTLLIRDTKFFKSRLVPIAKSLADAINDYLRERLQAAPSPEAFLFLNHRRRPYSPDKFGEMFQSLLKKAGIHSSSGNHRPRVHDVRHSFALNCLLRWYQQGADLQAKLPLLATYMGHASVLSTQEYFNASPELLREACQQFERRYGSVIKPPTEDHQPIKENNEIRSSS